MRNQKTSSQPKALDEFVGKVAQIRAALEQIQVATGDHFGLTPEEIHWGHVGDAGRVLEGLEEILAIVGTEAHQEGRGA